jgi:predicted HicB family RNase H-like nuclease
MRDKPLPKTTDEFIQSAKSEADILGLDIRKDKTFLLRIPLKLHALAKMKAQDSKIPLHDFIITAIKEKVLPD